MRNVLDRLCDLLDEELERQELVLAVTRSQEEAIMARDIGCIQQKTAALEGLIRDAAQAEKDRKALMETVAQEYGLAPEKQSMSGLISVAPGPWADRLRHFQKELRGVLEQTRRAVHANRRTLRQSQRIVQQCIRSLQPGTSPPGDYTATGADSPLANRQPALIDQRG